MNFAGLLRGRPVGMHGGLEGKVAPLKKYSGISQLKVKSGDVSVLTCDMN